MRHNQNGRRYRGRGNGGGGGQNHHHNNPNNGQRRINPRVHTFDSNGPDVRIRGNAFQITEKYQALAKDAAAAGDRVLAESYLQHAEHYQRLINETSEEYNRHQQQQGQHPHANGQQHPQQDAQDAPQPVVDGEGEQPSVEGMADLDQSFLVGPRRRGGAAPAAEENNDQPAVAVEPRGRAAAAKAAAKAAE